MPKELVLGTAGHIDHGKTALVRALTGIDTDRLAAEKERGISIDIGYAHLEVGAAPDDSRLAIVDLPGHERFIRNMLAGASGIDIALLVIASDDSVMPQTREHLAILELLAVPHGLIVLTKTDLAEPSWLDLVEDEVRELVKGSFLEAAPIVRTSATTGAGLDDLRAALDELCRRIETPTDAAPFRIAVDRSFVVQGLGTVVTGTVWSGRVAAGDELDWLPGGKPVRVRGLQSHGREVPQAGRGTRAAINLAGAHHTEIGRGDELAAKAYLEPTRWLSVRLDVLPESPRPLKHRARVRLHLGTREVMASVWLLEGTSVEPGQTALAQLACAEPVAAVARQPFVIRAESPVRTIGGGRVLQPCARRIRRRDRTVIDRLQPLADDDAIRRAEAAIYFADTEWSDLTLCRDADLDPAAARALVAAMEATGVIVTLPVDARRTLRMHRARVAEIRDQIHRALERLHADTPLSGGIPRERLQRRLASHDPAVVDAVVAHMVTDGVLVTAETTIALASFKPKLTEAQRRLRDATVTAFDSGGFAPPDPTQVARAGGLPTDHVQPILDLCVGDGELVHLKGDLYLHRKWDDELKRRVQQSLAGGAGMTVSEIKDVLETSRKYAIPFCEYLDRIGITERRDDRRVLRRGPA